eukprot:1159651-Pelagomonas_calceolata.AAC.1
MHEQAGKTERWKQESCTQKPGMEVLVLACLPVPGALPVLGMLCLTLACVIGGGPSAGDAMPYIGM